MDAQRSSRTSNGDDDRAPMPAAFRRHMPRDTAETAELWRRHAAGDHAAFQALTVHYLPLARMEAKRLQRRNPGLYADPIGDHVQDATFGLMHALRNYRNMRPAGFQIFCRPAMRRAARRAAQQRRNDGHWNAEKYNVVARLRGAFVQREGRLPSLWEMTAELAGLVPNPNFYAAGQPDLVSDSQAARPGDRQLARFADGRERDADARAIDAEVMALAMKGLFGADRQLFRRVVNGESAAAVAKSIGLTADQAVRRVNGLLWEARQRADLATYLGVEPSAPPQRHKGGDLVSVRNQPPARKVG